MNVVKEIARINKAELDIAIQNPSASWHQQYNDSAYIFIGGLPYDLTEGDVITIFSQYGEIIDVNLPRVNPNSNSISNQHGSPATYVEKRSEQPKPVGKGKHRGFGFLMYEDQRSTVLAVDNLNGTQVLGRTLRVDHVAAYKQPKVVDDEGNKVHADTKIYNAAPQLIHDGSTQNSIDHEADLEDPMAAYLQGKRVEDKGKARVDDEWEKQEKRRRKEERASIRAQRQDRRSKGDRSSARNNHDDTYKSSRYRYDQENETKRHRSSRHRDDKYDQDDQVNRYQQMKKSRDILDMSSEHRHRSSRHRSHTPSLPPPLSSSSSSSSKSDRHAGEDLKYTHRHHRDDDDDRHRRQQQSDQASSRHSASRRRSRSPRP